MRAVIVAICCGGAALFLQGCGSGSSTTCLASQLDIVSQSISGSITGSVSLQMVTPSTTVTTTMPVTGDFVEMLDLSEFNMYTEQGQDVTVDVAGVKGDFHVETKAILLAGEQKAITYIKMTNKTSGETMPGSPECTVQNLTGLPTPTVLSLLFQTEMATVRKAATCGGNDGTYDTWTFAKGYDGPIPKIPSVKIPVLPNISSVSGWVSENIVMTKDSLLHSAKTSMHAEAEDKEKTNPFSMNMDVDMTVKSAKKGGPSKTDLDYSTWGECKQAPGPVDLDRLFMSAGQAFQFPQTYLQQHVISTIKAAMKADTNADQTVVV